MATIKTVKVTVAPTLTGDTVASYNAYSSIDGLLVGSPMTPAEAAAGKDFSLSDGATHSITVKAVWATAGETTTVGSNAVSVTTTSSGYGIEVIEANDEYILSDYNPATANFDTSIVLDTFTSVISDVLICTTNKSPTTVDGSFQIKTKTNGTDTCDVSLRLRADAATQETADYAIVATDRVGVKRVGTTISLMINGVSAEDLTITTFTAANPFSYSSYTATTANLDSKISEIDINAEKIIPTSQSSGATIVGTIATLTLVSTVSVDAMYYAI